MRSGWYRSDSAWWYNRFNQTYTWGGATNFFKYLWKHGRATGSHTCGLDIVPPARSYPFGEETGRAHARAQQRPWNS
jgi:hypothetical protein